MAGITDTITSLNTQQEVELAQALAEIQSNGGLAAFSTDRINELMTTISQEHSDTAVKNFSEMEQSQNSYNNIMYYYARNKDLNNVQQSVLDRSTQEALGAQHDSQLAKRQFEINEWSAGNKAETLFLMQLFLMAVTFTIFMLFLNRMGVLPTFVFVIVSTIIFIAFILTFAIRYQYTTYSRSNRYWNRKSYPDMSGNLPPSTCPGPDADASGVNYLSLAEAEVTTFAQQAASAAGGAASALGNSMTNFGTAIGSSGSSSSGS